MSSIKATGPEGRIVKADVEEFLGNITPFLFPLRTLSSESFLSILTVFTQSLFVIHLPVIQLHAVKKLLPSLPSPPIRRFQLWTMLISLTLRYERQIPIQLQPYISNFPSSRILKSVYCMVLTGHSLTFGILKANYSSLLLDRGYMC